MLSYGDVTEQDNKKYWVEKTPHNELYLNKASMYWPKLRAIYILRDPRDNFASYRKKRKVDNKVLTIENFILRWCNSIYAWRKFASNNVNTTLLLRYEDLVYKPQATMERICDFLQINWDDILLFPTRNGVFWSGNSMHGTNFEKVSTAPLGKYRNLLSSDEVRFMEIFLSCVMRRYRYEFAHRSHRYCDVVYAMFVGSSSFRSKLGLLRRSYRASLA